MLKPGDVLDVQAQSLAFGGEAIARVEGWVVFVRGVLPGEKASVEITERKSNYLRAKLLKILEASPQRIAPPCPYFPECGGCQYQYLQYDAQLQVKKQQVEDALKRLGKVTAPAVGVIPCPEPLHYRNRIKLHILRKGDEPQLGFMNFAGRKIVPIEHCLISNEAINNALAPVREQMKKSGSSKTVTIRTNPQGKVDFWTEDLPQAKGVTLTENVLGKNFEVPSASFFQVNPVMTEALVTEVESHLATESEILIDAYCGAGLFSVLLGKRFKEVVGIEQDQESARWARKNMRANGIDAATVYEGPVEQFLAKALARAKGKKCTVLLDPPRDGCHASIPQLLCDARPHQIAYVSCNPPTLARDLGRLCNTDAYQIAAVTLLDMFPQTMHCETVVNLSLRGSETTGAMTHIQP